MINNKIMFPLCGKCVEEQVKKPWLKRTEICTHTEDERCMIETWCTPELQKVVELGYQVKKIYEVWHFPEDHPRDGQFADYVNKCLKNKQEARGWSKDCVTEDQKAAYIQAYEEREAVKLENVEKNPGRKGATKLMLNR